LMILTKKKSQN